MKFTKIDQSNWEKAIELKIAKEQEKWLRSDVVLHSLAKCYIFPNKYIPYVIEYKNHFIGSFRFRYYGHGVNIVSFFIDQHFQGKGLGKKSMQYFIDWSKKNYPEIKEIELWVVPGNSIARKLYEDLGFFYTGEKDKAGCLYMEYHY